MKKLIFTFAFCLLTLFASAQSGYEININLKNSKDTTAYLTFYQFDKTYIKDSCTNIKNGKIIFKGKKKLDKGIYSLIGQGKSLYFDFFIDEETQKLNLEGDASVGIAKNIIATNSNHENDFFNYVKFIGKKNDELDTVKQNSKGLVKSDSIAAVVAKQRTLDKQIQEYEENFLEQKKGKYIADVLNLKIEKMLKETPIASNGRPDSLKIFHYYKEHYWDNVNFKDDGTIRNPFFYNKLNKYFENLVVNHPDSVAVEIDRMMGKTQQENLLGKLLLAHFTYTYQVSKIMGFDKVFVHIVDKYFKTGKANLVYDGEVIKQIIKQGDKIRPLLVGKKAPDLAMINATDRDMILKMGFETAKTSEEVTKLFYSNQAKLNTMFNKLHDIKSDYLILAFWDVDCSHCKVEIPKLLEEYHKFKSENKDVTVYCVYTQNDGAKYIKYINENKLDWINVYDGVHYNNVVEKYDVYSTPVIYVLDRNKIIKAKRIGVEQISDIIKLMEQEYKNSALKRG
jgi:alkyl hydroperoxide reductase subunit AhpC